jgi:hypothetical protein
MLGLVLKIMIFYITKIINQIFIYKKKEDTI